jgi:hypothetical protein
VAVGGSSSVVALRPHHRKSLLQVVVVIAGDVGGWGTGSQLDYQVAGIIGYSIKPNVTLQAGYRYLYVNYRSGGSVIQPTTAGVFFGATFNLK